MNPAPTSSTLTRTWLLLAALAVVSLLLARGSHAHAWMGWGVALLAWAKGRMVALHFMEAQRAGPVFRRIVAVFTALAPLGLLLMAWLGR
jgi:hypothetical protein